MESINAHLRLIKEKFQHYSDRASELYDTDPDFQSLCADYFLCMKVLKEYQSKPGEKQNLIKEYAHLRKVLEKDLRDFIRRAI